MHYRKSGKGVWLGILLALVLTMLIISPAVLAAGPPLSPANIWPRFHNDLAQTGFSISYAPNTSNLVWNYNTGAPVEASPAVACGMVYIGNVAGVFCALDVRTGALNWNYNVGSSIHSSAAVAEAVVYFLAEDGKLYALDAFTGAAKWTTSLGDGPWDWSSPAVHAGFVFVATSNGFVHKVNAATGAVVWSSGIGGTPNSAIAVVNGKVYSGTHNFDNSNPTLVALNETNGSVAWTYNYNMYHPGVGMINCNGVAVSGGKVYFGIYNWNGTGPQAVALYEATGNEAWAVSIGGNSTSTPAVHDGRIFIGSDDNKVYALNAATGAFIWSFATSAPVWAAPAVANGKVFFGSLDHWFYAVNEATGSLVWKYFTGTSRLMSSPAVANSRVFVGNENGKVYAFGPIRVRIDIKPGSDPNSINLKSNGVIPVAILGSPNFDVNMINVDTLRFGPAWTPNTKHPGYEDVNHDGFLDLVTHYETQDTGILPGQTEAGLRGFTYNGILFEGGDSIRIVPPQ